MIKAITFDLWNTIFENKSYSEPRIDTLFRLLANKKEIIDKKAVSDCYDHIFLNYKNADPKELYQHIYTEDRVEKVLKCLEINLTSREKQNISKKMECEMLKDPPPLKSGVIDILKELSSKYKIGLISNTGITPGNIIKKVLERYDLLKYFQITIFSDEIGYYKPKAILFQEALKHLKSNPENAIHIGDLLYTDIKGAKDCGMMSIWFNDLNQTRESDIIPDFEVTHMKDIIKIINTLK